jgi:hypothetical protein
MFYNTYRATKSSMRSAEKNRFTGTGQNIINQRDRLLNLQKRQKLKDLLITKFMQKYGINNPEQILEDEITKFLQGEKLNDVDLKRLDLKVKNLLRQKASKEKLKNSLTQSLQENTLNQNQVVLPKIESKKELDNNTINTISPKITKNQPTRLSTEPSNLKEQPKLSSSVYTPLNTMGPKSYKIKYKKPEEELAELEKEFAEEEEKKNKNYERLDFTTEGDEWSAIAKYNRKVYEDQIKEERRKDNEIKRRNKEDLDLQIKQRLRKEYEDELKEKEYDNIIKEHQKKMDELEREKQELIKKQIMREKESRDEQMRQNYMKKRIELLKEKKFERSLVQTIKEGLEKDKKEALERKKRENEALKNAIKENEIKIMKKKEQEKKEKEEDIKMREEGIKMQIKQDQIREKYYDMIKTYGNKFSDNSKEILEKMKKDQEEEDKKIQYYYDEKNRLAIEKEKNEALRRHKNKFELKKYLDMQIEERKKEEDFLKSLDDEQARIWAIDCKKYFEDEKAIENKVRAMNKRNLDMVMEQIKKKKNKKNNMSDTEYAMNRDLLKKAKASLSKQE